MTGKKGSWTKGTAPAAAAAVGAPRPSPGGGRPPPIDREEELHLLARAGRGDAAALGRLIDAHYAYVVAIARRYRGFGVPMSDLLQEGVLGLLQAVRRFHPDGGARLSTYAVWWIRASVQDLALRSWSVVRLGSSNAARTLALKLRQLAGEGEAGADETQIGELARRCGASAAEIRRLLARFAAPDVSLDQLARPVANAAAAGRALVDRLICERPTPEQALIQVNEARHQQQRLASALASLSERERFVIRERYFAEVRRTFAAIGRQLGVSKDRARQLEAAALRKLAAVLALPPAADSG